MFRLTRPPEAQIRTNLRPSVASVGLSFLGITLWNIPPQDLSGHGTEEHVAGRAEEHDVDDQSDTSPGYSLGQRKQRKYFTCTIIFATYNMPEL